jgi:hypothetical protein
MTEAEKTNIIYRHMDGGETLMLLRPAKREYLPGGRSVVTAPSLSVRFKGGSFILYAGDPQYDEKKALLDAAPRVVRNDASADEIARKRAGQMVPVVVKQRKRHGGIEPPEPGMDGKALLMGSPSPDGPVIASVSKMGDVGLVKSVDSVSEAKGATPLEDDPYNLQRADGSRLLE